MKKLIYIASILFTLVSSSCDDFLTVSSPDKMTTDKFWKNEKDVQAAMASAYAQLYHGDAYATSEVRWPVEAYRTDLYKLGSNAINYASWTDLYKFTYTNGNEQFSYYYKDLYRGINFANQIIHHLPNIPSEGISDDKRNLLMNEALFLRGYYHMMLLLNWEKIIIRNSYIENQSQLHKGLSERKDCWDFIIKDLKKATELPSERSQDELGRATSGAANAYLGFAFLTRAYEESENKESHLRDALLYLDAVKGYNLVTGEDFLNMFNGKNKNCEESIFELQYSKSTANGARYYSYIQIWIASSELGGWDEIIPSDKLFDEFKKEGKVSNDGNYDARIFYTMYFDDPYFNDGVHNVIAKDEDDNVFEDKYENLFKDNKRPVFRKFTAPTKEELAESRCAFNIPLMRYANVLLMKAEVLNEQGFQDDAIDLIDQVREKHGNMPKMTGKTYKEVKAQIEHERILEFPLESYRWYDLRRWGKLEEALQDRGYQKGVHDFYPIPLWEITANPELNK